jgi:hypothetical protein
MVLSILILALANAVVIFLVVWAVLLVRGRAASGVAPAHS